MNWRNFAIGVASIPNTKNLSDSALDFGSLVKWYNGGLQNRGRGFDSLSSRIGCKIVPALYLGHLRFPTLVSLAAFRYGTILRGITCFGARLIFPPPRANVMRGLADLERGRGVAGADIKCLASVQFYKCRCICGSNAHVADFGAFYCVK